MGTKVELPTLGDNTTPEQLVDILAPIRSRMNEDKTLDKFYSTALKVRADDATEIIGEHYKAVVTPAHREGFNQELAKTFLTEEQLAQCEKGTDYVTLRFTKLEPKKPGSLEFEAPASAKK
jgi:hypothetical protein